MPLTLNEVQSNVEHIAAQVGSVIVGKKQLVRDLMAALLAEGHILLEDYPGLGKTLLAQSFATILGLQFKRIQFTPDLLPGDITGGYVYSRQTERFELRAGPIFANIVLADEINRASPKTQSALLEAMQEGTVTVEGETMRLPRPFIVIATQNPIEYEGTFPLPEAQLDRFIAKFSVGYPSPEEEHEILRRRRERRQDAFTVSAAADEAQLIAMREAVEEVFIEPDLERYIVDLIHETRRDRRVAVGSSPRGSLALLKLSRAHAAMEGRSFVIPDDIKRFAVPALAHRLILDPELWMRQHAAENIVDQLVGKVEVPVLSMKSS